MTSAPRARPRPLALVGRAVAAVLLASAAGCSPRTSSGHLDASPDPPGTPAASARLEGRGKAIYRTGVSPSGRPVRARLADSGADVPAALLTCANCHGRDGIGRAEGGITPATITWDELARELGPSHPSGRRRPAYDGRSVGRAITMGLDPSGRALDPSMPRYALDRDDLDALVTYLHQLGHDPDPGLSDGAVVVGTIVPPGAPGDAVRAVLIAYFETLNRQGGVYGRRVELRCQEAPGPPDDRAEAARRFLERGEVFALVAPFLIGAEGEIAAAARTAGVPVLGPFALDPRPGAPLNRYVFYLEAGLADQAKALASFALGRLDGRPPSAAIVFDESTRATAEEVRNECKRSGWGPVALVNVGGETDLSATRDVGAVFVLSPDGLIVVDPPGAGSQGRPPLVLVPGSLAGADLLGSAPGTEGRLFLAFPTLPLDQTREGLAEYDRFAAASGLPGEHRASQIAALAAARIFVDALTEAGRAANRETLVEVLEHFYQRPNGLTRPISFGPNRRFGNRGAYVVGVDPVRRKLVPVSGFIEPPPR